MKWEWWIRSENEDDDNGTNNTKRSNDQLRSDMEWNHINYERNDGKDNDSESLGEGHSSLSQNRYDKVIQIIMGSQRAHIRTPNNEHTR